MPLLDTLNRLALEAGVDPAAALDMPFDVFARRLAAARELHDAERISVAVVARGPVKVSPIPVWRRGHLWARPCYATVANDRGGR